MQNTLFGNIEPIGLTISETAEEVNVSPATVRNWIKTGYLKEVKQGIVDKISLYEFIENIAGKEKLIARANKLMKDSHNHRALSESIQRNFKNKNWERVGQEYETSLSNSYRNKEGIYYTPSVIVDDMLLDMQATSSATFLDPCCGSGNFIIGAIRNGIKPENVYGFDTDANAVEITRRRVWEETGFDAKNNIRNLDFLENAYNLFEGMSFDFIFTNPPWGKKMKKQEKEHWAEIYQVGNSKDTTSLFYFACVRLLKTRGRLGFLVQEALFNISTFQYSRKQIMEQKLVRIIDYGKPFKGLLTKACAFIIEKNSTKKNVVKCVGNGQEYVRKQETFRGNPKCILNFWAREEEDAIIKHIYNLPHKTLQGKAKWALGIVTGNNAKYCKKKKEENHIPVYKGADITLLGLKTPTNFISNDFSKYQQVASLTKYQAPVKLIYKFISSKLIFHCDTEQRFILNSANLLIPDDTFEVTCRQLASLLSSDFMNWLFYKLFRTHKILRGDIEQLPIHTEYFQQNDTFSEKSYLVFLGLIKDKNGAYRIKK